MSFFFPLYCCFIIKSQYVSAHMYVSPADEQLTAALNGLIIKCSVTRFIRKQGLVSQNYAVPTVLLAAAASLSVDQVRDCTCETYCFSLISLYCSSCLKMTTLVGRGVRSAPCSARCHVPLGKYVLTKMRRSLVPFAPSTATSSYLLTTTVLSGLLCELIVFCWII